jgi:hypothetical protein
MGILRLAAGNLRHLARAMRGRAAIAAIAAAAAAVAVVGAPAAALLGAGAAPNAGCPEIILVYSRGSGQPLGTAEHGDPRGLATPGLDLYSALAKRYGAANVGSVANPYAAVPISWRLIHTSRIYPPSVAAGKRALKRIVPDLANLCPDSRLILAGFSQGAEVTHATLAELGANETQHVAAVLLFGDPLFAAGEANITLEPSMAAGLSFNPQKKGIRYYMFARAKPLDAMWSGRVFSWCHARDIVCQGSPRSRFTSHKTYALEIPAAVEAIARRLAFGANGHLYAVSGTCHGGTCAVGEWSGPGTTSFQPVGAVHEGQTVGIACQAVGQAVTGAQGGSSPIWDRLLDGAFVPDYYIDTPDYGTFSPRIPRCGALAIASP